MFYHDKYLYKNKWTLITSLPIKIMLKYIISQFSHISKLYTKNSSQYFQKNIRF